MLAFGVLVRSCIVYLTIYAGGDEVPPPDVNPGCAGAIPIELVKLTNLRRLDLSQNKLRGRSHWRTFSVVGNVYTGRVVRERFEYLDSWRACRRYWKQVLFWS